MIRLLTFIACVIAVSGQCVTPPDVLMQLRFYAAQVTNNITLFTDPAQMQTYRDLLASVTVPDYHIIVPPAGVFGGLQHGGIELAFEYYLLGNPAFNSGLYQLAGPPQVSVDTSVPDVIKTTLTATLINRFGVTILTTYNITHHFQPCGGLMLYSELSLPAELVLYISASQTSVLEDCQKVQQFCTGPLQQFSSLIECAAFYVTLPRSACGASFLGDSLNCRYLHTILLPFRPSIHCNHVGPQSIPCSATTCRAFSNVIGDECAYNFRFNNGDCAQIDAFEHYRAQGLDESDIRNLL